MAFHTPKVCHRGVAGDDQIAVGDDGNGLQEIPGFIDLILATDETFLEGTGIQLFAPKALLEREQGYLTVARLEQVSRANERPMEFIFS